MADFAEVYSQPMTEEETENIVEKTASEIVRRGLQTPAILFLEMHKPLSGVMGHASVAFAPFALPFVGFDRYADLSRLISSRENVERLLRRIEALSKTPAKEN